LPLAISGRSVPVAAKPSTVRIRSDAPTPQFAPKPMGGLAAFPPFRPSPTRSRPSSSALRCQNSSCRTRACRRAGRIGRRPVFLGRADRLDPKHIRSAFLQRLGLFVERFPPQAHGSGCPSARRSRPSDPSSPRRPPDAPPCRRSRAPAPRRPGSARAPGPAPGAVSAAPHCRRTCWSGTDVRPRRHRIAVKLADVFGLRSTFQNSGGSPDERPMLNRLVPVAPSAISQSRAARRRLSGSVILRFLQAGGCLPSAMGCDPRQFHIPHAVLWLGSTSPRAADGASRPDFPPIHASAIRDMKKRGPGRGPRRQDPADLRFRTEAAPWQPAAVRHLGAHGRRRWPCPPDRPPPCAPRPRRPLPRNRR
jgi:hypothetical protein